MFGVSPSRFLKANFDANFEDTKTTSGIIFRNSHGSILKALISCSIALSPFAAEAKAALQASRLAKEMEITNLVIKGDALNVISSIKGDNSSLEWQGKQSILSCRNLFLIYVSH